MKHRIFFTSGLLLLLFFLPGCEVVKTIFEAGVWTGVILVLVVIAVLIFILVRLIKKMKQ